MSTERQKQSARRNLEKARQARQERSPGRGRSSGMTTAEQNDLDDRQFAFPEARKEPIHDAAHVRAAIARFDQVEDVSDTERDAAWRRIKAAAKRFDIEVEADDWRELFEGGKARQR